MKALLLCAAIFSSACSGIGSQPATPAAKSPGEQEAIDATNLFWKAFVSALGNGELEPLSAVCERESVAWANIRAKLLEDRERAVLSIFTEFRATNFSVSVGGGRTTVTHRLDLRGYEVSASSHKPLEAEQTLAQHATVRLERFGKRLLVSEYELKPWH